nr:MAG TPA: hypothetical protein [Caudoviricetes sp.]
MLYLLLLLHSIYAAIFSFIAAKPKSKWSVVYWVLCGMNVACIIAILLITGFNL